MINVTPTDVTGGAVAPSTTPIADAAKLVDNASKVTAETPQEAAKAPDTIPPHVAAAMARKEKELRAQKRQFEAERQQLLAEKAELEKIKAWQQRLKDDPLTVLSDAGIDYDQLTQAVLQQGDPNSIALRRLQQEILALKQSQSQTIEQSQKIQEQQYEQAKRQIRREVDAVVASDPTFEVIQAAGYQDAVVELIEQTFNDEGYVMNVEDAAREVANAAIEEAVKLAKLQAIQQRLTPAQAQAHVEAAAQQAAPQAQRAQQQITVARKEQPGSQTLSNRMVVSAHSLNNKDRIERAIRAFNGQL